MDISAFSADKDIPEEVGSCSQAQTDANIVSTHEVSDMSKLQPPKEEDIDQDSCIEKLEIKDQEQKYVSSINKTEKAAEKLQKKPSLSKLKTMQKPDSRVSHGSSAILSKKAGTSMHMPGVSAEVVSGAVSVRLPHSSRGSIDANLGSLVRLNGGGTKKGGSAWMLEAQLSTSGLSSRSAHLRRSHSNFTVPQPFALATDKRASLGGQPHSVAGREYVSSRSFNSQIIREGEKKIHEEKGEDLKQAESNKTEEAKVQFKVSVNTFNFNSDVRAQRRKEFNSRLEERLTAKEAEKTRAQARTKEDIQQEIKKFRKSLTFKATPMPSFYQDSTPPKVEIKKRPPTRAKSPKLGRRNSSTGAHADHKAKEPCHHVHANHGAKENNNGQMKSSTQAAETKKTYYSSKVLKQVAGPNASSENVPPSVLDKMEVVGHLVDDLPSEECNNGEADSDSVLQVGEAAVMIGDQTTEPGEHVHIIF